MNTPVLNDNLRSATEALCNLLAKEDKDVASKAKLGLFFQNLLVVAVLKHAVKKPFSSITERSV